MASTTDTPGGTTDACKAPEVDPRRAATLAELHRVVKNTARRGHDLPAAIIHMAIRMESAARMDRGDPELDWRLVQRANDRRFNALRRLAYAAVAR